MFMGWISLSCVRYESNGGMEKRIKNMILIISNFLYFYAIQKTFLFTFKAKYYILVVFKITGIIVYSLRFAAFFYACTVRL